jgi:hypothetical protein
MSFLLLAIHVVKNVGGEPLRNIAIELKPERD